MGGGQNETVQSKATVYCRTKATFWQPPCDLWRRTVLILWSADNRAYSRVYKMVLAEQILNHSCAGRVLRSTWKTFLPRAKQKYVRHQKKLTSVIHSTVPVLQNDHFEKVNWPNLVWPDRRSTGRVCDSTVAYFSL